MLELGHEHDLIAELWEATEAKVRMPDLMGKYFFEPKGPTPVT
jgi:hypothetical protein